MAFPGVPDIRIAPSVEGDFDAAIIMECGDLRAHRRRRPRALLRHQHRSSSRQHRLRPDQLVRRRRRRLRRDGLRPGARARRAADARDRDAHLPGDPHRHRIVPLLRASRRGRSRSAASALEAGVDPVLVARNVYDSNNMGRLKLFGAVLSAMQIDQTGRIAIVYLDHEMARAAGGTYEDTEGLINLPLTVKEIQAVVFFKQDEGRRVPRQPAVEGRHRHRRDREGVRRRRPQERRRLHRHRPDRRAAEDARREDRGRHRWTACWSSTSRRVRPRTTSSRACAARCGETPHRPHRHARSDGDRRAAARRRPRDAARAVPERERQVVRRDRPPRLRDRHRATRRAGRSGRSSDGPLPSREAIDAALDAFRGTFLQQPPAFSAKKIDGQRSYKLARDARAKRRARARHADPADPAYPPRLPFPPRPASPRTPSASSSVDGDLVTLRVDCSAGFYVRSLAHDLGERLGIGAHLAALRRTRTGDFGTRPGAGARRRSSAIPQRAAGGAGAAARACCRRCPSVVLTADGVRRVVHGRDSAGDVSIGPRVPAVRQCPSSGCSIRAGDLVGDRRADAARRAFASLGCSGVTC